jgi:hypothetical protein
MSLSDVKLDHELIASLYRNNLVQTVTDTKTGAPALQLKYLGNNQQHIVILVKNPAEVYLADIELNLLTKMLSACKLTLADVAILNIAQTPVQQEQLHSELHPSKIIMLGVESKDILLPMNFPEYRVQPHGPCSYLMAPGLSTMVSETDASKNVKTQLWVALKQLFGL